jgi:hypothetical protein
MTAEPGAIAAVRERAHLDAGADHVCIQPMTPEHPLRVDDDALTAIRKEVG